MRTPLAGMDNPQGLQIVTNWIVDWIHAKSKSNTSRSIISRSEDLREPIPSILHADRPTIVYLQLQALQIFETRKHQDVCPRDESELLTNSTIEARLLIGDGYLDIFFAISQPFDGSRGGGGTRPYDRILKNDPRPHSLPIRHCLTQEPRVPKEREQSHAR